jgi:hypothetical protein
VTMSSWQLSRIDVAPGEAARVTFKQGDKTVCLHTSDFAVGQRDAKTAALAKFVAASGLGDVTELFHFFLSLPDDWDGPLPID